MLKNNYKNKIYDFIIQYMTKNGYSPSIQDISNGVEYISTSTVYHHLMSLQNEGKIKMAPHQTRAIQVVGYGFVKL